MVCNEMLRSATSCNNRAKRIVLSIQKYHPITVNEIRK